MAHSLLLVTAGPGTDSAGLGSVKLLNQSGPFLARSGNLLNWLT